MKKRIIVSLALIAALILALTACQPATPPTPNPVTPKPVQRLSIGTSTVGGQFYLVGGGWASMINSKLPAGYDIAAEVTGGSNSNIVMIESGEIEFGTMLNSSAIEGYTGSASWTNNVENKKLRSMFPMAPYSMTIFTLESSGVKTMSDLNGKKVGLGSAGAGVDTIARDVFNVLGITPGEIHNDAWTPTVQAVANGVIDVAITFMNPPWPALLDLEATRKLHFVAMTEEEVAKVVAAFNFLAGGVIPAGAYQGTPQDVLTVANWALVAVSADLSEDTVYELAKATFENLDDLVAVHRSCEYILPENCLNLAVPLHPGVIKYLREKGITVPARLIP